MVNDRLSAAFSAHRAVVERSLRRFGVSEPDVEDALQQAFCVLATRLDRVEPEKERAFLFAVALRIARSSWRETRARQTEDGDLALASLPARSAPADDLVAGGRALAALSPALQEVVLRHELEGMTMAEIAEAKKIAPGTVASRLRRARTELARLRSACAAGLAVVLGLLARTSHAAPGLVPAVAALAVVVALAPAPASPPPPRPASATAPLARVEVIPAAEVAPASPPAAASAVPRPRPRGPRAVDPREARPNGEGELELVVRAKKALVSGDLVAAEQALAERDRLFPGGVLADEGAVLHVELLTRRGEDDAAREEARRFLDAHPASPYERRLSTHRR